MLLEKKILKGGKTLLLKMFILVQFRQKNFFEPTEIQETYFLRVQSADFGHFFEQSPSWTNHRTGFNDHTKSCVMFHSRSPDGSAP